MNQQKDMSDMTKVPINTTAVLEVSLCAVNAINPTPT